MKTQSPEYSKAEQFILTMLKEKLSPDLVYHHLNHTLDVLRVAMIIADAEALGDEERKLLRLAALFHDAGFIYQYKDHEGKACEMVEEFLPAFQFIPGQIDLINEIILATRIPQEPKSQAARILADADLDYLGREDFYPIAHTLYEELRLYNLMPDPDLWIPFQIAFLKSHRYFTEYSRTFREPNKKIYLESLIEREKKG